MNNDALFTTFAFSFSYGLSFRVRSLGRVSQTLFLGSCSKLSVVHANDSIRSTVAAESETRPEMAMIGQVGVMTVSVMNVARTQLPVWSQPIAWTAWAFDEDRTGGLRLWVAPRAI